MIDFWNNEKERLVALTSKCLYTIKYDFIALKILDVQQVPLEKIDTLMIGELQYPSYSLLPSKNIRGLRIMWNQNKPLAFIKKWNPLYSDIPWKTYISHPLLQHQDPVAQEKSVFIVDLFAYTLVEAVQTSKLSCAIKHQPIILENYIGLGSLIHNKLDLGFSKVRGKISF